MLNVYSFPVGGREKAGYFDDQDRNLIKKKKSTLSTI